MSNLYSNSQFFIQFLKTEIQDYLLSSLPRINIFNIDETILMFFIYFITLYVQYTDYVASHIPVPKIKEL